MSARDDEQVATLELRLLKFLISGALVAACLGVIAAAHADTKNADRHRAIRVAITIDDLPAVPSPGWTQERVLDQITEVLRRHGVPKPVGFLNGGKMEGDAGSRAALGRWLEAGFVLGNHTYSHIDASAVDTRAFQRDVVRNQRLIEQLTGHKDQARYFRYPYLHRGRGGDEAKIRAQLLKQDYKIADVSVDIDDCSFAEAYLRCSEAQDDAGKQSLQRMYLEYALAELTWSDDVLARSVGHRVPQVLLLHANALTAQSLDSLLTTYERAGAHFVTLDEAMRDDVYTRDQAAGHGDVALIPALTRMHRASAHEQIPSPRPRLEALCR